jgi:lysozyme
MDKEEFINSILTGAISTYEKYKILPSVTLAQAITESFWGEASFGNNLFGIKWQDGCGYERQYLWTTEFINGEEVRIQDWFRKYDNWTQSIEDHGYFLYSNNRYKNVIGCYKAEEACEQLQLAGYATDPNYAKQLINLIKEYNLTKWDGENKMELTKEQAKVIVKEKTGFTDATIQYMADDYRWGDELIIRLANALLKGGK